MMPLSLQSTRHLPTSPCIKAEDTEGALVLPGRSSYRQAHGLGSPPEHLMEGHVRLDCLWMCPFLSLHSWKEEGVSIGDNDWRSQREDRSQEPSSTGVWIGSERQEKTSLNLRRSLEICSRAQGPPLALEGLNKVCDSLDQHLLSIEPYGSWAWALGEVQEQSPVKWRRRKKFLQAGTVPPLLVASHAVGMPPGPTILDYTTFLVLRHCLHTQWMHTLLLALLPKDATSRAPIPTCLPFRPRVTFQWLPPHLITRLSAYTLYTPLLSPLFFSFGLWLGAGSRKSPQPEACWIN